uniref:FRIGIDA-like protein n=1 Tax=Fagus sylvatica TaxID=28930 RepID=A0A2N9GAX4_FAGSY
MEKFSSELKLIEMKQSGLNKAFETLNSQASSVLLLTLQWKDLEEHLDSTRKSIETRFKELEVHEKEMVLKEEQLGLVKRELGEKETEVGLVLEKIRLDKEQMVFMHKSMEQLESKKQELGSVESSLKECCDELRSKEVQLEMVKNWVVKYRDEVMVKGKEVKLAKKRLDDCVEVFVLKKKELCGVQKLIEERTMELKLKEQHVESIKVLIEENSEELEVKEKQYDKIGRLINERTMELKVKEKEVESIDECIKERSQEIKSKKKIFNAIEKKLKDAEPKWKQLEELEVKEKQYDEMGRSIEEHKEELGSKGIQLNSTQNLIKVCDKELELKAEELCSIQKAIVGCSKEQKSKEKELDLVEESIKECTDALESKEKQLKFVQETANERLKELELEGKHLDSLRKSIEERSHNLEMRERQVKERLKELDLKEKQVDSIQISLKVAMEEKGKNNTLPAQVKIEQPESTPANNAIVAPYPASLRPCVTMGGRSLQLLLNKHLQRHEIVRAEVSTILQTSSDPSMLVLDAMHGFYPPHSREEDTVFDVNIIRRSCILLLEQLMKTSPVVEPQVREEAMKLAVEWKAKMKVADDNCLEVLGFLQLLASYGLGSGFNEDELRGLLATIDQHRQAPELCRTLGIIDKAPVASTLHSQVKMELSEDLPAKNVTHSSSSSSSKLQLSATTYGSLQFLNEQLNGPDVMGNEILSSLQMSLNPAKLVLNVMQGSFPHIWEKGDTGFEAGVMKNYILMLEHLKRVSPQIHPQIKEEATQ